MNLSIYRSTLHGEISVPGSKSHTIRACAIASSAEGVSTIRSPLVSGDTLSALHASRMLGGVIDRGDDSCWRIAGCGGRFRTPDQTVDMANSGTSIKIFAALFSLGNEKISFDGDSSLRSRPMEPLLSALEQRMVRVESCSGKCPFSVTGPLRGGEVTVNGESSQYVTAMLMALPLADGDSVIHVENLNEKPYIGITLKWLEKTGIKLDASGDLTIFRIPGNQKYHAFEAVIPADFSTAAFPLIAAAVTQSELTIEHLDFSDAQGDKAVFDYLEHMGVRLEKMPSGNTKIIPHGHLKGGIFDLNATPDALPAMAAAACFAEGKTILTNVAQARIKETDRIACMTKELRKMGAVIEEQPDGMVITGRKLHGAVVESYGDHRIAMALATAGLASEGETVIRNAECAAVTYPGFFRDFSRLGADFREG